MTTLDSILTVAKNLTLDCVKTKEVSTVKVSSKQWPVPMLTQSIRMKVEKHVLYSQLGTLTIGKYSECNNLDMWIWYIRQILRILIKTLESWSGFLIYLFFITSTVGLLILAKNNNYYYLINKYQCINTTM